MPSLFKSLFGSDKASQTVTAEKAEEIFEYGRLKNLIGTAVNGWVVRWTDKPSPLAGSPSITNPAHIEWAADPRYAFAAIVDGKIERKIRSADFDGKRPG